MIPGESSATLTLGLRKGCPLLDQNPELANPGRDRKRLTSPTIQTAVEWQPARSGIDPMPYEKEGACKSASHSSSVVH
jgi:hypothetical protein